MPFGGGSRSGRRSRRQGMRPTTCSASCASSSAQWRRRRFGDDAFRLIELDMAFHLTVFRLSGLEALEQILTRCTLHTHRSKLWAPGHRRPLLDTARRHDVLLERLAAGDAAGLAQAVGEHIDTIVDGGASVSPDVDPQMQPILDRLRASAGVDFKAMPIAIARQQSDAASIPWSEGAPAIAFRRLDHRGRQASLARPPLPPRAGAASAPSSSTSTAAAGHSARSTPTTGRCAISPPPLGCPSSASTTALRRSTRFLRRSTTFWRDRLRRSRRARRSLAGAVHRARRQFGRRKSRPCCAARAA